MKLIFVGLRANVILQTLNLVNNNKGPVGFRKLLYTCKNFQIYILTVAFNRIKDEFAHIF